MGRNTVTVQEGGTAEFIINTKNIRTGTRFYYTVSGIDQSDLTEGSITGFVEVQAGQAVISLTLANDLSWQEGTESINITVRRARPDGAVVASPGSIVVNDSSRAAAGQVRFFASTQWTVPTGVTSISMVCVGPGGRGATYSYRKSSGTRYYYAAAGGGGGGLGYRNNWPVTPGQILTVTVGITSPTSTIIDIGGTVICQGTAGEDAYRAKGGNGGGYVGTGGGVGGTGATVQSSTRGGCGGGGAGGYSGRGGQGSGNQSRYPLAESALANSGGGAGGREGSGSGYTAQGGGGGGGVGLYGIGYTGQVGNFQGAGGEGGSGGLSGATAQFNSEGNGGGYGGGGGGGTGGGTTSGTRRAGVGFQGAARIIWPGDRRQFPSTLVEDI